MVASVGSSYNVLSLFQKPEGSAAAADTAAADAIIETIQQMKSDTSPARLQGASAATQAWIESAPVAAASEVEPAEADASAAGANEDGTEGSQLDASGRLKGISAEQKALIADMNERAERMREKVYAVLVDLEAAGLGDKMLLDKANFEKKLDSGGGSNVLDLLKGSIHNFNSSFKFLNSLESSTLKMGPAGGYRLEQDAASGNWTVSSEAPVVDETRQAELVDKFTSQMEESYEKSSILIQEALKSLSSEDFYKIDGDVVVKNDDGTYGFGVFSISVPGAGVYVEHDGSGFAQWHNNDGSISREKLFV